MGITPHKQGITIGFNCQFNVSTTDTQARILVGDYATGGFGLLTDDNLLYGVSYKNNVEYNTLILSTITPTGTYSVQGIYLPGESMIYYYLGGIPKGTITNNLPETNMQYFYMRLQTYDNNPKTLNVFRYIISENGW